MPDFKFFSPGPAQLGGILAGAQGILQGGQAHGAGLAAEGQALGQAYANIGQTIGKTAVAISQKKEQEALLDKATTFAESVAAGDLYETHSYTLEDEHTTPALSSIRSDADRRIADGMDPIQSNSIKIDKYMEYFQEQFDLDPEAASRRVDALTAVREERVMTPQGRSKMVQGAMALTRAGFDPNLLRTMIDAGGTSGYARTQDLDAAKEDMVKGLFTLTPAQERQQAVKLEAAKEEAKAIRDQRKRAQAEFDIHQITSKSFDVPTPFGVKIPTGARITQRATTTPGKVTGATKTLVERARGVNLPTQAIEDEMAEPIEYTPITPQQANEIREALTRANYKELDDEMKRRKLFTGEDDPLLQEVAQARVDDIMRNLNQDAPRFAGGVESQGDATLIERLGGTAIKNIEQGNIAPFVTVDELTTLDAAAISSALEEFGGAAAGELDVKRFKLRIGKDGEIEIFPGSLGSAKKEREIAGILKRGAFASTAVRDELALRQSRQGLSLTKSESLKFWEAIRSRSPEAARYIIAGAGKFLDQAPAPDPVKDPAPGVDPQDDDTTGLTDAQKSLLKNITDVGVTRTPGTVPTAESNAADSRRRAQLPPAEDPVRKQRRESAEEVKPQANELADAIKAVAVKAINGGDNRKGQRLLQIVAQIRKAITLNDRQTIDHLIKKYSSLIED